MCHTALVHYYNYLDSVTLTFAYCCVDNELVSIELCSGKVFYF